MKRKYNQEEANQHMFGKIYINKEDANVFVRRKGIYSWTMNLGNKWSWFIMCAELFVVMLVLWLISKSDIVF